MCASVGPQPTPDGHLHRAGREKASSARPSAVGCAGSVAAGRERRRRPRPGLLLDVGDVELVQHPEPGPSTGRGGQVLQHTRRTLCDARRTAIAGADHPQRQTGPVLSRPRCAPATATRPTRGQTVRGGDRQASQSGDLGQRVLAALGERQQYRGDLAGDRPAGLQTVPGQAIPPRRWGSGRAGAASWLLVVPARHQRHAEASPGRPTPYVPRRRDGRDGKTQPERRPTARGESLVENMRFGGDAAGMRGGLACPGRVHRSGQRRGTTQMPRLPCSLIASHRTKTWA